jgi:hypothetical protein
MDGPERPIRSPERLDATDHAVKREDPFCGDLPISLIVEATIQQALDVR